MHVYLVEDSIPVRDRLKCSITDLGGKVVGEACSETEALAGLRCTQTDVAIVDLNLADGNGLSVIRKAREIHPDILIVVFTNHGNKEYERISIIAGADFFVDKAYEYTRLTDLLEPLRRIVERRKLRYQG